MFRLDYLSCLLTIASTVLVGRRMWQGWIIAGANSLVICFIGLKTTQLGFIPANLFCLAIYAHNIVQWRNPAHGKDSLPLMQQADVVRLNDVHSAPIRSRNEITSAVHHTSELLHGH